MRKIKLLAASLLAAGAVPALASPTVRDGIEAWQKRDFTTAVAIWRPLAENGDADAAFNLGQAYRLGRGVKVDLANAQKWLEQAAHKGHLDAQTTLGLLLFDSGDRTGAMRWLKSSAERGDPRALLVYGTALFNGDGMPSNRVLAYAYVSRAAAQGLAPAKTTLAELDKLMPVAERKQGVAIALAQASKPKAKAKYAPAAAAAKPAGGASGPWRIQLGAFSQRTSAETLFRRLSASAPVAGRRPFLVPSGKVTRLQVGPFATRAQAASACASLSSKGQPCFPVAAK